MKTPLCRVCQLTGVLCPRCEEKYKSGEVTKLDIEVSVALSRLTKDIKELEDVEL
ncbi:MAG TPA: transcription elongation factor, partial [Armatimonadetes bacterium]|nr:transcription elongation factor [Armatimonadota bacterium]